MDSENRLTVVLVGHPELRRRMGMAALDALAQRIVVRANVRGIARDDMGAYLAHWLRLAGSELPLFEPPTVEAIFQASSGCRARPTTSPTTPSSPPPSPRPRPSPPSTSPPRCKKSPKVGRTIEAGSLRSRAAARPLAFRHRKSFQSSHHRTISRRSWSRLPRCLERAALTHAPSPQLYVATHLEEES